MFLQFVLSGDVGRKRNEEKGAEDEAQRRKENTLTSGALEFLSIYTFLLGVPRFLWISLNFFGGVRFLRSS